MTATRPPISVPQGTPSGFCDAQFGRRYGIDWVYDPPPSPAQLADTEGLRVKRIHENYQHFLAYSGLPDDLWLRYAYLHGAGVGEPRPGGDWQAERQEGISELEAIYAALDEAMPRWNEIPARYPHQRAVAAVEAIGTISGATVEREVDREALQSEAMHRSLSARVRAAILLAAMRDRVQANLEPGYFIHVTISGPKQTTA